MDDSSLQFANNLGGLVVTYVKLLLQECMVLNVLPIGFVARRWNFAERAPIGENPHDTAKMKGVHRSSLLFGRHGEIRRAAGNYRFRRGLHSIEGLAACDAGACRTLSILSKGKQVSGLAKRKRFDFGFGVVMKY